MYSTCAILIAGRMWTLLAARLIYLSGLLIGVQEIPVSSISSRVEQNLGVSSKLRIDNPQSWPLPYTSTVPQPQSKHDSQVETSHSKVFLLEPISGNFISAASSLLRPDQPSVPNVPSVEILRVRRHDIKTSSPQISPMAGIISHLRIYPSKVSTQNAKKKKDAIKRCQTKNAMTFFSSSNYAALAHSTG